MEITLQIDLEAEMIQEFSDKNFTTHRGAEIVATVRLTGQEGAQVFREFVIFSPVLSERKKVFLLGKTIKKLAENIIHQAGYGKPSKEVIRKFGRTRTVYHF